MKKIITLLFVLSICSTRVYLQEPTLDWVNIFSGNYMDWASRVNYDAYGNVYCVVNVATTVDFDPGPGVQNVSSGVDMYDTWIFVKYNASGNFQWVKEIHTPVLDAGLSVADVVCDSVGNTYYVGYYSGHIDFNPGSGTNYLYSGWSEEEGFILKLDAGGNFVWVKNYGISSGWDHTKPQSIALYGPSGILWIIGEYTGTVDINPTSGTNTISSNGGSDIFIITMSTQGSFYSAQSIGGTADDWANNIEIDKFGGCVISGYVNENGSGGSVDMNVGSGSNLIYGWSGYLLKLNTSGFFEWVKSTDHDIIIQDIKVDTDNNIYYCGRFSGVVDFDLGAGIVQKTALGTGDAFTSKINPNGDLIWVNTFGGNSNNLNDVCLGMDLDFDNNIYCIINFNSSCDFDPGPGTMILTSASERDASLAKYDSNGGLLYARRFGSGYDDLFTSIRVDKYRNIFLTGFSTLSIDFDPTPGIYSYGCNGGDAFLMKLNQPISSTTLYSDQQVLTVLPPSYYNFMNTYNTWGVIGVRSNNYNNAYWGLSFYTNDDFLDQLETSDYNEPVNFVVYDQHHLTNLTRGVKVFSSGNAESSTEFEAYQETLSVGITTTHNWPAGDVAEIWDVWLPVGSYKCTLSYNSGLADLDMALYGSLGGPYFQNKHDYIAQSSTTGNNDEVFFINIQNSDHFGLVVWANDSLSANVDILIETTIDGLWEGDVSTNWHTAGNWNNNSIPTSSTDVVIPAGTPYSPSINSANAYAKSLSISSGASLTMYQNDLFVQGNLSAYGEINLYNSNNDVYCYGDANWEAGSECNMVTGSEFRIYGDWNLFSGNDVHLNHGTVVLMGSDNSSLRVNEPDCWLYSISCSKTSGAYAYLSSSSDQDLHVHGDFILQSGSKFVSASFKNLVLHASMVNNGGHFEGWHGAVEFVGTLSDYLRPNVGDYFHDLIIDVNGSVDLWNTYSDSMVIKGDLFIIDGTFDCNNHTIVCGNDWTNLAGSGGFLEKTGTVIFNRDISNQYCNGDEFYNVIQTDDGGILSFTGSTVISNNFICKGLTNNYDTITVGNLQLNSSGNFSVKDSAAMANISNLNMGINPQFGTITSEKGSIIISDLVNDGLYGTFILEDSLSVIDITQGSTSGEYIDLNGSLFIQGGLMIVRGGSDDSYWPYSNDASITMSNGVLDFPDQGIRIHNSSSWSLTSNITGGTIRTANNFKVYDEFNPAGGSLELYGSNYQYLYMYDQSSELHDLLVNKSGSQVDCSSGNIRIANDFTIDAGVFGSPDDTLFVGGNWINNVDTSAFLEGNNTVCFNGSEHADIQSDEAFFDVVLDKSYFSYDALVQDSGVAIFCNDFHVIDGCFEIDSWATVHIMNNLIIEDGAGFNANDGNIDIFLQGNLTDNNVSISTVFGLTQMSSSSINWIFIGNSNQNVNTQSPDIEFGNLLVDKAFPYQVTMNNDFLVNGDLYVLGGNLMETTSPGIHTYLKGNLFIGSYAGFINFNGTLHFVGSGVQEYECLSIYGHLGSVEINPTSTQYGLELHSNMHTGLYDNMVIQNGHLWSNGYNIKMNGDLNIQSDGVLVLDAGSQVEMDSTYHFNIQNGGLLLSQGTEQNPVIITSTDPVNYWQFNCFAGGTISAEWTQFGHIDEWGVYIWPGGIVDNNHPFDHCTFLPGKPGGSLFWIENDQVFNVNYASFPDQGSSSYNVHKNSIAGQVTFINYLGSFSGETNDFDPNNNVIWTSDLNVIGIISDVSCYSGSDGSIDITVSGGTAAYTYLWNDGSTVSDRANLTAGQYTLSTTDQYGYVAVNTFTVNEPGYLYIVPSNTVQTDVSCNGGNDGSIILSFGGGTPPYTFQWNNGASTASLYSISAGVYSLTITDYNGCIITPSYLINEPDAISLSALIMDVTSYGGNDGSIDLSLAGGTSPYTYLWSTGATTEDLTGLTAGTFSVSVTDDNSCQIDTTFQISEALLNDIQNIALQSGWGIFSSYIDPVNPSLDSVFQSILGITIIVKDGNGSVYWPSFGLNLIGNMTIGQGYQVKMLTSGTLSIIGTALVPENTPLTIQPGWSIIAYLRQSPAAIDQLFSSVSNDIDLLKNGNGMIYWPSFNVNTIGNMMPGQGYQIKAINTIYYTYPANSLNLKWHGDCNHPIHFQNVEPTGESMTIGIPWDSWIFTPKPGDEIGVYSENGTLVGSSLIQNQNVAFSIWGNDELSLNCDGLLPGNKLNLVYWDGIQEQALEVIEWRKGVGFFDVNSIQIVSKIQLADTLHAHLALQNNPNPFKNKTRLDFVLPNESEVCMDIVDVNGNRIGVLVKGTLNKGTHMFYWDAKGLPPGVYYARLITNNVVSTVKLLKI